MTKLWPQKFLAFLAVYSSQANKKRLLRLKQNRGKLSKVASDAGEFQLHNRLQGEVDPRSTKACLWNFVQVV